MSNLQLRNIARYHAEMPEKVARERKARQLVAKDMAHVLTAYSDGQVRWKASKTDLMEALHWTWLNDTLANDDGSPCEFCQIVERACRLFRISEPPNPRCLVSHAMIKKGVRSTSLCHRCAMIALMEDTRHPLMKFIDIPQ